jgi:hypothetical protein
MLGHRKIANFDIYSFPKPASYMLAASAVALALSMLLAWRGRRKEAAA